MAMTWAVMAPTEVGGWMFLAEWNGVATSWDSDGRRAVVFSDQTAAATVTQELGFGIEVMHDRR